MVPSALLHQKAQALRSPHARGLQGPGRLLVVAQQQVVDFRAVVGVEGEETKEADWSESAM